MNKQGCRQRRKPGSRISAGFFGSGCAVCVVRDEKGGVPKWDELLKCKCDIDATLQELMDNRLVWNEARFCFVQERDKNLGGNSLFRSEERIATEKRYLKRKWKAHIRLETYKSQDRVAMDAPRRQSVKLQQEMVFQTASRHVLHAGQ